MSRGRSVWLVAKREILERGRSRGFLFSVVFTTLLAIPMSLYMAWIMDGRYHQPAFLRWFEKRLDSGGQTWKQYAAAPIAPTRATIRWFPQSMRGTIRSMSRWWPETAPCCRSQA